MAVEAGQEELGLVTAEAAEADASPEPRRFGKRAAVAAAALLLGAGLVSVAALAAMRQGTVRGSTAAVPAGAHAQRLWDDNAQVYVVHHGDPGYNHDHYEPAPVYRRDDYRDEHESRFVTVVHHDALPVYHGDAYHGSAYHGSYNNGYGGYHYHTYYHHKEESSSMMFLAVLGGVVLLLCCLGSCGYCYQQKIYIFKQ